MLSQIYSGRKWAFMPPPEINPADFIIEIKPEDYGSTNRNPLSDALICSFTVE